MNPKLLSFALALLVAPLGAQGLTPQQVMNLKDVIDVVPSPDAPWLVYTVAQQRGPEAKPGPANLEAFVIPLDQLNAEPRKLPEAHGVAWQPGAGLVTWVGKSEDEAAPQVFGMPADGGAVQKLSATPNGVGAYAWRPDGKAFAYTALDPETGLRRKHLELGFAPVVVDEDFRHMSLWLWDVQSKESRRLTAGMTVQDFVWSPTGDKLAVAMSPRNLVDDHYVFTRLYVVESATGEVKPLVDNPGKLGPFCWSPDGESLAYVTAADRNDPHAGSLAFVSRGEDHARWREFARRFVDSAVNDVHWLAADQLMVLADRGVQSMLWRGSRPIPLGDLQALDVARPAFDGRAVAVASRPDHAREVYVQAADGAFVRRTNSNPWLADVVLGEQEVVRITARDGLEFEGLLIHPIGGSSEPTPLVVIAHGGPESHYTNGWLTRYSEPGQVFAGMGYHVWYPNYRSSTGYGVEFAKADHGDPMGKEFTDHLDAIDRFAAQGLIDPERVGIQGGSYGGYTAAWAATRHSERFAAAVSFVPFTDIRTKWLTSDIPNEFYLVHYQEQWPHEQPGLLADRSPLTWAPHCTTPLLLCGGDADPRVHPSQPFMLYRAVKFATDTPTRYVQYPGEGHGNRTSVYRYDYLLRSIRWLDWYLRQPDRRHAEMPPKDLDYPAWR